MKKKTQVNVTRDEQNRLRAMASAGATVLDIVADTGRDERTVRRHVGDIIALRPRVKPVPLKTERDQRLMKAWYSGEDRDGIVARFGLKNRQVASHCLSRFRRRLREAGQMFAEAAE